MATDIKKKMEENSKAWHTADAATKKKLEAENQRLGSQLGASYNSSTGTWSDKSGGSLYGSSGGPSTNKAPTSTSYNTGGSRDISLELRPLVSGNNYDADTISMVERLMGERSTKALSDPSLYKYANDDLMTAAQNYLINAKNYQQTQDMLAQIAEMTKQPQYQSPIQGNTLDMVNGIANRPDFKYNHLEDPSWQAYATQFGILGDQAMADTLGDVSSMTGGLPSSYAVTAAAQAKNQYNQKMTDIIPTLMDAAYQRYQADIDTDMSLAGLMGNIDSNMYNQFSDSKSQSMDAARWLAEYGYNASRDQKADQQYDKEFDYMVSRDKIMDEQWMQQFTADEQQRIIQNAIDNRQVSVSEGNLALSRIKYKDGKEADAANDTTYYGEMYQEMLSSGDPEGWIAENAGVLTKEELEWLRKNMPNGSGTGGGLFE